MLFLSIQTSINYIYCIFGWILHGVGLHFVPERFICVVTYIFFSQFHFLHSNENNKVGFVKFSDRPAALARPVVAVRCVLKSTDYKLIPLASADVWPFCTVLFFTCFSIHRCKINAPTSRFSRFTLLEPAARVNWKSRARSLLLARAKYC